MKKLILTAMAVFALGIANAQEQTKSGKLLVEVNTGFGNVGVGGTSIGFSTYDGGSNYNFGAEGGYFVIDNLALKVGLGFGGNSSNASGSSVTTSLFGYKVGAKYYLLDMVPIELSYNGYSQSPSSGGDLDSWIGIQAGYAVFLGDMVSLEPGIRYNYSLLGKDKGGISNLQFNVGFTLHF